MYGCDRMVSCDPTHEEEEIVRAYWEMSAAVQIDGKPVKKMAIEITRGDNFSVIGWRVYENTATA